MGKQTSIGAVLSRNFTEIPLPIARRDNRHRLMATKKMIVIAKAREAMPDSANRPKMKVTGSTKKNARMQPVLSDTEAKSSQEES